MNEIFRKQANELILKGGVCKLPLGCDNCFIYDCKYRSRMGEKNLTTYRVVRSKKYLAVYYPEDVLDMLL